MEKNIHLTEMLKQVPQKPGVYMMGDSLGNIIYVGKAKNLKNRVTQYFRKQKDRDPKVAEMISHIQTLNYIVTDTELDALIEECRIIKKIAPIYNRQMKNNKNYVYIKITAEQYPKVIKTYEKIDESDLYFGPFSSTNRVETTLEYLNTFYPIRKCNSPGLKKRAAGCLFRELGTCLGVCSGRIKPEEYRSHIDQIRQLLQGHNPAAVRELHQLMDLATGSLNFEKAARYRDYYLGLQHIIGKQRLIESSGKNKNVMAVEFVDKFLAKVYLIKGNKLLYSCKLIRTEESIVMEEYLKLIIEDKFKKEKSEARRLTQDDIDEAQIICSYLKRNRNRILSFKIPTSCLNREKSKLDEIVISIVNRIANLS